MFRLVARVWRLLRRLLLAFVCACLCACVCVCVFVFVAFAGVSVCVFVCVCCVVPFAFRSVASVVRLFVVEAPFLVASVARGPPSLQHVVFACLFLPLRRPL